MLVQTYLSFEGRCEEALEFYKKALGAKVTRFPVSRTCRHRFRRAWCRPAPRTR